MKRSFKTSRGFLPGLVLILLLSVALLSTNGFAKYNRTITLEGQVRYAATETETKLADSLELLPVGEQAFLLIPGTTVAPEAVIEISGKTEVPAYLYVEIVNNGAPEAVAVTDDWKILSVTGEHGGQVYVYSAGPLTAGISGSISVLRGGELGEATEDGSLGLYAVLAEATGEAEASFADTGALRMTAGGVSETFTAAVVSCEVNEDGTVTNTGNIPVLIRVISTLSGEDGEPQLSSDWTRIGEYRYYNGIVAPGESTTAIYTAETGSESVTMQAQAVPAQGSAARTNWQVSFEANTWSEA